MDENDNSKKFLPGISIGLPVYNGEKFLNKRIKGILNQTFQNFEIIISNNASTDLTEKICLEIQKQDSRIIYHKQSTNIGSISNFDYVLQKAKREFFVWAAVDDEWDYKFLEKNFEFLVKNKEFVGSVTKESFIKSKEDEKKIQNFSKSRKKIREKLYSKRPNLYPIKGNYSNKIRDILKSKSSNMIYGVMKTQYLQKCMISERFLGDEWPIMFNIVKYGSYNEFPEKMLLRREHGEAWKGILYLAKKFNTNSLGIIFPNYPLTSWCLKNFESSVFLKNLDQMIMLNFEAGLGVIFEILLIIKNKITK